MRKDIVKRHQDLPDPYTGKPFVRGKKDLKGVEGSGIIFGHRLLAGSLE